MTLAFGPILMHLVGERVQSLFDSVDDDLDRNGRQVSTDRCRECVLDSVTFVSGKKRIHQHPLTQLHCHSTRAMGDVVFLLITATRSVNAKYTTIEANLGVDVRLGTGWQQMFTLHL